LLSLVDLEYENLPEFCTHCNMGGHYLEMSADTHTSLCGNPLCTPSMSYFLLITLGVIL